MLEIEIKSYCEDHAGITGKIKSLGGKLLKKTIEKDIYFKHPVRDFKDTDEAFRIRIADNKNILTYKGPKIGNKTKTRFEKEVEFMDLDSMKEILDRLGFNAVDEINKTRTIFRIDDVEICLDNVEGLGSFIELEVMGMNQMLGEDKIFHIADKLGLTEFETKSYLELKSEKQQI
jgi:adenylate cyclase, class 2